MVLRTIVSLVPVYQRIVSNNIYRVLIRFVFDFAKFLNQSYEKLVK